MDRTPSDSWDTNKDALREWFLGLAGAFVLWLYELAFHPPFGAPVADQAVAVWGALAGLAPSFVEGLASSRCR